MFLCIGILRHLFYYIINTAGNDNKQDILSANIIDYIINISSSALFCDEEEKYYRRLDAFPLEKHCLLCYNIQIKLQKD